MITLFVPLSRATASIVLGGEQTLVYLGQLLDLMQQTGRDQAEADQPGRSA